jgi:hypothetical protein
MQSPNDSTHRAHGSAIRKMHNEDLGYARSINGSCGSCKRAVEDTGKELRCKIKGLKLVKSYNICNLYKERYD